MDINYLLWLQEMRIATGGVFDGFIEGVSDFVVGAWAYLLIGLIYWCINKKKGAEELAAAGGLKAFKEGFVFRTAGGTESKYNDDPEVKEIIREGKPIRITSNVYISESEYTLGITGEYRRIIERANIWRDMLEIFS